MLRAFGRFLPAGFIFALAACATQSAPHFAEQVTPLPDKPIGFHCPVAQKQSLSDGRTLVWLGADRRLPDVCVGSPKPGYVVWNVRGIVNVPIGDADTLKQVRAALAKLTTAAPGATVSYTIARPTVTTATVDPARTSTVLRDYTLSIRGSAPLTTPAGTFDTILLEENASNSEKLLDAGHRFVFTTDYWLDAKTGVVLQARAYKWDGTSTEWTTTKLEKNTAG